MPLLSADTCVVAHTAHDDDDAYTIQHAQSARQAPLPSGR